jgi:lactate permease
MYNTPWKIEDSAIMNRAKGGEGSDEGPADMTMIQAFVPYLLLTAITLIVLLIQPIKNFLGVVKIGFAVPETVTGYGFVNAAAAPYSPVAILTHAFTFLLIASVVGFFYYAKHGWVKSSDFGKVLKLSVDEALPSAIAVVAFLVMSRLMSGTGQTVVLARGIVEVLGQWYAVLAAIVGTLGSFMTSSNMASNVLFADFQLTTAELLGFDPAPILGAQTAGGAIGNTICPGNIILGTTTAGILGQEGLVLKKILPLTLTAAAIVGVILLFTLVIF